MNKWGLTQKCKVDLIFKKSIGGIQKKHLVKPSILRDKKSQHPENGRGLWKQAAWQTQNVEPSSKTGREARILLASRGWSWPGVSRKKRKVAKIRNSLPSLSLDKVSVYAEGPINPQANPQNKGFGRDLLDGATLQKLNCFLLASNGQWENEIKETPRDYL